MRTIENIGLTENERSSVLLAAQSLKKDSRISKVILFGSRARGGGNEYSDIDLLVLTTIPVTSAIRGSVSDKLAEINIERNVVLSSVVISENDWVKGLIHYMPIYGEVKRDGCEV